MRAGEVMCVPAAREIDLLMKRVPKGRVVTTDEIKAVFAKRERNCDVVSPETTLSSLVIAGHAAEEARDEGEKMITPYWRTLLTKGEIFSDYPGGAEKVAAILEGEGHVIVKKKGKYFVANYQKRVASLDVSIDTFVRAPELGKVAKKIQQIARPSIRIKADAPSAKSLRVGTSKFGGLPDLPDGFEWPVYRVSADFEREPEHSYPPTEFPEAPPVTAIPLVAQIRLSEVAPFDVAGELPKKGWLWFFSDMFGLYQYYGMEAFEAGTWRSKVLFCPDEGVKLRRREPPAVLPPERPFRERALHFREDMCVPQYETCWLGESNAREGPEKLLLTSAEMRHYIDLRNDLRGSESWHRLLGYSDDAQPMLMERGYKDARSVLLPKLPAWESLSKAKQYAEYQRGRLLLQIQSEEDINPGRWGRGGFFIRGDDLKKRRFDRAWYSES